jgi:hypothetical protein
MSPPAPVEALWSDHQAVRAEIMAGQDADHRQERRAVKAEPGFPRA